MLSMKVQNFLTVTVKFAASFAPLLTNLFLIYFDMVWNPYDLIF